MKQVIAKIDGEEKQVAAGTEILELVPDATERGILGAVLNHSLAELNDHIFEDSEITFLDMQSRRGHMIYQRSAALLLVYAVRKLFGIEADVMIKHSVNKNLAFDVVGVPSGDMAQTLALTSQIEEVMREAVSLDLQIDRQVMSLRRARSILKAQGDDVTLNSLRYIRSNTVMLYNLGEHWLCLHGPVVPSAGYIKDFSLYPEEDGFILRIPNPGSAKPLLEFSGLNKVRGVYNESGKWARVLGIDNVGALNAAICEKRGGEIIRINEALHEKSIAGIADEIFLSKKNIVLVAGPSSSGKTTFSHRLCVHLSVLGLLPKVISLDNYFNDAKDAPTDEFGKPDFENFSHVDRTRLNKDLVNLLKGKRVELPVYNFQRGTREYKGDFLSLTDKSILVIEGIHGLNDALTDQIDDKNKYKIFISAMTQINLDRHNRIPTSDTRLIRRIVRDMNTRGYDPVRTLSLWESVSRGEEKNIFPWQESVDVVFNSALVYEMCILKQYVEALLFGIADDAAYKADARRLLGYLDAFVALPPDEVPINSILREFIGGGLF